VEPAIFKSGDRVLVSDTEYERSISGRSSPWSVVCEDTNRTPVVDLQPAYKLVRARQSGRAIRYAYQDALTRLE
jgi:hypothetical protein